MVNYQNHKVEGIKIAYVGGGSRTWAWGLMSDLVSCPDISGEVALYDINFDAAKDNEIIGNKYNQAEGAVSQWNYTAVRTAEEAMTGADFVIISILPGTFDEMESDVHTPEKYGIYQSVGDTAGPGGVLRAMRTVPMYEEIAENIKKYCPDAWVISYTNPMTLCVKTLYRVFPEIKAFGCCHEIFGVQKFLAKMIEEMLGLTDVERSEIRVNPIGVNHFTWLTEATYHGKDLFPYYKKFCDKYKESGYGDSSPEDGNWFNAVMVSREKVKMDLFDRFGYIAAAGDRHLAEFCEGKWYLSGAERLQEMCFGLTSVEWRKNRLKRQQEMSRNLLNGNEPVRINVTGEEGVQQIRALLGLTKLITNVNIPNQGQIPNLPLGAVVETNAAFYDGTVRPVFAGEIPKEIYPMIARICGQQEALSAAIAERNLEKILQVFVNDPLVTCGMKEAEMLFEEMCENTKSYLTSYNCL